MSLRVECSVHCACVTVSCLHWFARMPLVFFHLEYCDMHFYQKLPQDGTFMFLVFVFVFDNTGLYFFMYYYVVHPHTQ